MKCSIEDTCLCLLEHLSLLVEVLNGACFKSNQHLSKRPSYCGVFLPGTISQWVCTKKKTGRWHDWARCFLCTTWGFAPNLIIMQLLVSWHSCCSFVCLDFSRWLSIPKGEIKMNKLAWNILARHINSPLPHLAVGLPSWLFAVYTEISANMNMDL